MYFLEVDARQSGVYSVALDGRIAEIARQSSLFEKPCTRFRFKRTCQVISEDGHVAILIRSTNWVPDELIKINLTTGAIETLATPLIDPARIGVAGLSYGAEIAMYAYWRADLFTAVSVASASWEPVSLSLHGPEFAQRQQRRGYTWPVDAESMGSWRMLSAGMNARPTLPPLLIQSSDGERNATLPTWTALRRKGAAVEWYEYPEAETGHVKQRPANRWYAYRRNFDWFRFWLQGYEDPAPERVEQYARWRKMRENLCARSENDTSMHYCVN